MDLFTTILCILPLLIASAVVGHNSGHKTGFKEGYRIGRDEGLKTGVSSVMGSLLSALREAGYKDTWINGLADAINKQISRRK